MSTAEIKSRMITILDGGSSWCKRATARDQFSLPCAPLSDQAVEWDIIGALIKANWEWWTETFPNAKIDYTYQNELYDEMMDAVWPNRKTEPTTTPIINFNFDLEHWNDISEWSEIGSVLGLNPAPILPPSNLSPPVISGEPLVGNTITVTPGTWDDASSISGEWYVGGIATGNTTLSLTIGLPDAGKMITYTETATNVSGSTQASASIQASEYELFLVTDSGGVPFNVTEGNFLTIAV